MLSFSLILCYFVTFFYTLFNYKVKCIKEWKEKMATGLK